ncbi:hypothetical protein V8E53_002280 [Lactarius tabidus]
MPLSNLVCPYCPLRCKSQHGRTRHVRVAHGDILVNANIGDNPNPNDGPRNEVETVLLVNGPAGQRKEHPHLTALPCDSNGKYLPLGSLPQTQEGSREGDWTPFEDEVQFELADLLYRRAEVSAGNIDFLLELWSLSMEDAGSAPFGDHGDMHAAIDSSALGDAPWQCLTTGFSEGVDEGAPTWMHTSYEVWYRDPDVVVSAMLANPDFNGQFDLRAYIDLNAKGERRWGNVMSGNIAWRHSDDIFASNPDTEGAMYCLLILGSDKTTVSVATGHVEYHPLYLSIGNPHSMVRRAHRHAVIPIAFLAIPKSDRDCDSSPRFRAFKRQLYHASVAAILRPLLLGMTSPVIRRCPDGHLRRVIYDLVAFIADYPEQVMLTGIVQGWCAKCTALPGNLDSPANFRTPAHTECVTDILDSKTLWTEYGIDDDVIPFTSDFPCANIHEMISPDLLHQLIKGVFKDHLVTWVGEYLLARHGERRANAILDDIDRRIAAAPPFPGLRRFPHGRRFKQWTGDDSKALMKVYLPAIIGYVPDNIVMCLGAFLDACYITRRQDINTDALEALDHALGRFWRLCEIFRTSGVRSDGFSLTRQHALFHYRRMIEDFGAPGGLCSSITESRHITAIRRPWRRSNRYRALGQMLLTNQRLDKLAAMRSDFTSHGMIRGGHTPGRNTLQPPNAHAFPPNLNGNNDEDDDDGPVDENILGHVVLAQSRARQYPRDIESLSLYITEPALPDMTRACIADQLGVMTDEVLPIRSKISVFHSAVATFLAPSDRCGLHGMHREQIRSTPSWRGLEPRYDCAFLVEDDTKEGMLGLVVVRVKLLFSFIFEDVYYPFALVEWFNTVGFDPVSRLWVVRPDTRRGRRYKSVVHLDAFLRAAHLIPVYGKKQMPLDLHCSYSLDVFQAFYVNKYIDHHANEIV